MNFTALPITVPTKIFFKIKNYFDTMCTQNRLNGLAMMAIEHELSNKFDFKEVIRDSSEKKVVKGLF